MAGRGNRFKEKGFSKPKYEIKIKGRTLFNWSISSFKNFFDKKIFIIFICLKSNKSKEFIINEMQTLDFHNWDLIQLDEITNGQATTALKAKSKIKSIKAPIIIYNIDTYINPEALTFSSFKENACIPCFKSKSKNFSFVKLDGNKNVIEIEEKKIISELASVGLYGFKSFEQFQYCYNNFYSKNRSDDMERFIAPIYNELISRNEQISVIILSNDSVKILGTPEELEKFKNEA